MKDVETISKKALLKVLDLVVFVFLFVPFAFFVMTGAAVFVTDFWWVGVILVISFGLGVVAWKFRERIQLKIIWSRINQREKELSKHRLG